MGIFQEPCKQSCYCKQRSGSEALYAPQVESEDVVFALETIVENFGGEMAPFAVGLCQHLARAFWRLQVSLVTLPCLISSRWSKGIQVGVLAVQLTQQACGMGVSE